MICTIRIPDVLQARIDSAAGDESRSKWILEACRMRLDCGDSSRVEQRPSSPQVEGSIPSPRSIDPSFTVGTAPRQDLLAKLRASVAAIESKPHAPEPEIEIPLCHKTWWEDGEQYECLMDKGHKNPKHGQFGKVINITQ
jgi:hypothetical protein